MGASAEKTSYGQWEPMREDEQADRRPGIVDEFREAVVLLTHEIHLLSEQLAPVLKPEFMDAAKVPPEPEPLKSDARSALDSVRAQARRIATIREQLEV